MDDPRIRSEGVELARDPVVESRPEGDEQITLLQSADCRYGAVHSGHTHVQWVAVGEGTSGHQCGDDRDTGEFGQLQELLVGMGLDDAATDVEHRLLCLDDHASCLTHLLGVWASDRAVAGQIDHRRPLKGGHGLQRILGDVNQHRSWTSGGGDMECLGNCARNLSGIGDQEVVLGDGHRDAADIRLLKGVCADGLTGHLTGDGNDRHRIHVGISDRGDEIGGARTRGGHTHTYSSSGLGVTLRRMPSTLLMTHQNVPYLRGVHQWVVCGKDRPTRDTEDDVHSGVLHRADEALGTGDLVAHLVFLTLVGRAMKNPPAIIRLRGVARRRHKSVRLRARELLLPMALSPPHYGDADLWICQEVDPAISRSETVDREVSRRLLRSERIQRA